MIKEKLYHYLPGDMGGGGIMKKVTNGDGWGCKIWHFCGDVIFEWPLKGKDFRKLPKPNCPNSYC